MAIIKQFERIIDKIHALELKEIHPMLDRSIWLLSEDYVSLSSNKQMKTFLYRHLGIESAKEEDRPDFICRSRGKLLVIIELKHGSYKLTPKDLGQVSNYVEILKKYRPNTPVNAWMIGGSCEARPFSTYGETPIRMTTYSEIIDEAKDRFKEYIENLKNESSRKD